MRAFPTYFLLWIFLSVIGYLLIPSLYPLPFEWRLFATLNVSTFLLYLIDKTQARNRGLRVPERLLYLASFLGGSIGALAAMKLLRHKTSKVSFQIVLALLILLQILIVLWYRGIIRF